MGLIGSEKSDGLSEDDLTDIDKRQLNVSAGDTVEHEPGSPDQRLTADDLTDLDAEILGLRTSDNLLDRHTPLELVTVVSIHVLPAFLAVVASASAIDTSVLAPSIGLDLFFLTGLLAFSSGVLTHITRTVGTTELVTVSSGAVVLGASGFTLTLVNAAVAPSTFLTAQGYLGGFYAQMSTAVVTLSVIGALLIVSRLLFERVVLD